MLEWLERSAREYQSTIVKELSKPSAPGASPQPPRRDGDPRAGFVSAVGDVVTDVQIAIQEWLARANRTYQTEIMRKLEQPVSAAAGIAAGPLKPPPVSKSAPPSSASGVKVTDVDVQGPPFDGVRGEEDVRRGGANGTRVVETADRMSTAPIGQGGPASPPLKDSQPPSADEAGRKRAAEEADARKAEMQREGAAGAKRQSGDAARPKATASPGAEETASKRQQDAAAERLASQRSAEEAGRTAGQDRTAEIAGESNAGVAAKSAEFARRAVEQARGGPAKRAEQMQVAQPQADVAPRAASHGKSAKAVASKTDDRIAEGSAEKGPVDRPKSKGAVSEGAADAVAATAGDPEAGSHAGRAVIALSPRRRRCARAGQAIRPPGSYVVGSGDTLSEIAERHYGTSRRMWRIVKSNRRKLRDPDFIRTCQRIWLP